MCLLWKNVKTNPLAIAVLGIRVMVAIGAIGAIEAMTVMVAIGVITATIATTVIIAIIVIQVRVATLATAVIQVIIVIITIITIITTIIILIISIISTILIMLLISFPVLMIGSSELFVIAAIVLLLFGAKKIPELMKSMGQGVRYFKKGMNEDLQENNLDSKGEENEVQLPKEDK